MRFIADTMLGRLARWLRLMGCDVEYPRRATDDELLFMALVERRKLLTRDVALAKKAGAAAYLVRANSLWDQLREVASQFGLRMELRLRRCPVCNGEVVEVPRESVEGAVPRYTFLTHRRFWRCSRCGKIFWRGSHIKLAEEDIRSRFGSQGGQGSGRQGR